MAEKVAVAQRASTWLKCLSETLIELQFNLEFNSYILLWGVLGLSQDCRWLQYTANIKVTHSRPWTVTSVGLFLFFMTKVDHRSMKSQLCIHKKLKTSNVLCGVCACQQFTQNADHINTVKIIIQEWQLNYTHICTEWFKSIYNLQCNVTLC